MGMNKKKNSKSLPRLSSGLAFERRKTRLVKIGEVSIGGGSPIVVQSMAKTHTKDIEGTVSQIKKMVSAGCEVVRLAIPDRESVEALGKIKKRLAIPLVADIHFDHKLALASLDKGVDALRINPGNIGAKEKVREVVQAAKDHAVPIRIGVNSGSLEKNLLRKYGKATAEAMVESALRHVRILEDMDFHDVKISLKAPDVFRTVKAYQLLAEEVDYPFHAGITESGSLVPGSIRSSVGLALLLSQGLVDTVRVSLTAPPEEEVRVAFLILSSLGLRSYGPHIISCPVCGRCEVDLMNIAQEIEKRLATVKSEIHLAVMGCMVNGPGEAKEADIGLACGQGNGVLFKEGKIYRQLEEKELIFEFVKEVKKYEKSRKKSKA